MLTPRYLSVELLSAEPIRPIGEPLRGALWRADELRPNYLCTTNAGNHDKGRI